MSGVGSRTTGRCDTWSRKIQVCRSCRRRLIRGGLRQVGRGYSSMPAKPWPVLGSVLPVNRYRIRTDALGTPEEPGPQRRIGHRAMLHTGSAYSFERVNPSGELKAASTMTRCQAQWVNAASLGGNNRVRQVRCTVVFIYVFPAPGYRQTDQKRGKHEQRASSRY